MCVCVCVCVCVCAYCFITIRLGKSLNLVLDPAGSSEVLGHCTQVMDHCTQVFSIAMQVSFPYNKSLHPRPGYLLRELGYGWVRLGTAG